MALAKSKYQIVLEVVSKSQKAFSSLNKGLKAVGKFAAGAGAAIGKLVLGLGGLAAALVVVFRKSFNFIDTLGKTALRTGITTKTLQAFQLAAIESGSSIEQTQKGLVKFARSIGDAGSGLKTQADIFKDLGVEIKNSDGTLRSFDDILMDTADGVQNLGSDMERTRVLANLFGRAGAMMSEVFRNGSQGLEEFIERAQKLGIVLDQNTIDKTQKFNDSLSVIQLQFKALTNNITAAFLPVLQELATEFGAFMTKIAGAEGGFAAFARLIAIDVLLAIENVTFGVMHFMNIMQRAGTVFGLFGDAVAFTEEDFNALADAFAGAQLKLAEVGKEGDSAFAKIAAGLTDMLDPLAKFRQQLEQDSNVIKGSLVGAMKSFEDSLVTSLQNGKLSFKSFSDFVIKEILRIFVRKTILGPIANMIPDFSFKSFDGGGFTGSGSRSGGIDGKGGFPAILHPNETVIDHTQGQTSGGTTVNFNINTVDAQGFDSLLASRKQLITQIINNAMHNNGKMGVV
ncbi:MAG: hypothetical protein Tp1100SUR763771_22 [Prokaryotic dsDNA virus sp.]|nr:MAG: hypothetical protein Tp1100SUR763771_22 [Prokaryotic dsDNA virus sp.]|tara:strand:+ start:14689 stop:16227 length:1539 start_codon:yes stop_codon:yes gene_type:complete